MENIQVVKNKKAYLHQDLAGGRWQKFSLVEQLANIGAEIGQALAWKAKGDEKKSGSAGAEFRTF